MELTRREMIALTGAAVATCCTGCMGPSLLDKAPETVDAGPAAQWNSPGIDKRFRETFGFFMISDGSRVYAQSAVCTHRGCTVKAVSDGFDCPCHGSKFAKDGHVLEGPASQPLPRLAVETDANNHIIVHPHRRLEPAQFNNPEAAVMLKA